MSALMAIAGVRKAAKELVDGTLRVQIDIEPRDKAAFHAMFPDIDMPVALAPLQLDADTSGSPDEPAVENFGEYAKELRLSGFFRAPHVWEKVGSDAQYQTWCRGQRCAMCHKEDIDQETGEIRNEYAHVRRAGEAGTGHKPEYSGIPLCHVCHWTQHEKGESAIGGREKIDAAKIQHIEEWAWSALKAELGYESWSKVAPFLLYDWAVHNDVEEYLPKSYRPVSEDRNAVTG